MSALWNPRIYPYTGLIWTKLRRQQKSGLSLNLICVSCVGPATGWKYTWASTHGPWQEVSAETCWISVEVISATAWRGWQQRFVSSRDNSADTPKAKLEATEAKRHNSREDNKRLQHFGHDPWYCRHQCVIVFHAMLLCFGSRRQTRQHRRPWNDKDFLLGDEHQAIVNPYFLESGNIGSAWGLTFETPWHCYC